MRDFTLLLYYYLITATVVVTLQTYNHDRCNCSFDQSKYSLRIIHLSQVWWLWACQKVTCRRYVYNTYASGF